MCDASCVVCTVQFIFDLLVSTPFGLPFGCGSEAVASLVLQWDLRPLTCTRIKDGKAAIGNYMELAASELKMDGAGEVGGCLDLKLTKKPARPSCEGALRVQSEANGSFKECACASHEELEGSH